MSKQKKQLLWIAIIVVAILDAFSTALGAVPVIGDIAAAGSNLIWEAAELALVFGLVKSSR